MAPTPERRGVAWRGEARRGAARQESPRAVLLFSDRSVHWGRSLWPVAAGLGAAGGAGPSRYPGLAHLLAAPSSDLGRVGARVFANP